MIVDRMENARRYDGLGRGIRDALQHLASIDGAVLPPGRTPIGEEGLLLVVRDI